MQTVILYAILATVYGGQSDFDYYIIKPAVATVMDSSEGIDRATKRCNDIGDRMIKAGAYQTFSCVVVDWRPM